MLSPPTKKSGGGIPEKNPLPPPTIWKKNISPPGSFSYRFWKFGFLTPNNLEKEYFTTKKKKNLGEAEIFFIAFPNQTFPSFLLDQLLGVGFLKCAVRALFRNPTPTLHKEIIYPTPKMDLFRNSTPTNISNCEWKVWKKNSGIPPPDSQWNCTFSDVPPPQDWENVLFSGIPPPRHFEIVHFSGLPPPQPPTCRKLSVEHWEWLGNKKPNLTN